ncbi:hypothetical protein [Gimesia sp.]|uniref:hypothetical protein n=1 Tax=Gimesia sp. TaxID=2024833 RepID=UPI003A95B638
MKVQKFQSEVLFVSVEVRSEVNHPVYDLTDSFSQSDFEIPGQGHERFPIEARQLARADQFHHIPQQFDLNYYRGGRDLRGLKHELSL